jgi:bifunctional DNA-binding transcriptional regulator/antitoxin component of YhaV-PrlF toxin-antitoxin module
MLVRTVRLTSKGQLSLPVDTLRALHLRKGAEFLLVQDGDRIILVPSQNVGKRVVDDLKGFEALALPAFKDVWDNETDEAWNDV